MELTLHTGDMGDCNTIYIEWSDENNIRYKDELNIVIREQDKPRILEIHLNGVKVAEINSRLNIGKRLA